MPSKQDFTFLLTMPVAVPTGREVRTFVFDKKNAQRLKQLTQDAQRNATKTSPRDDDPIIIVEKDGKLLVYDGNRRMLKAILEKKKSIIAYVARGKKQPPFFNHWIPTSRLLLMVIQANTALDANDMAAARCFCHALSYMIADSKVAQQELSEKILTQPRFTTHQAFFKKEIMKVVRSYGSASLLPRRHKNR
jgi:hypothetical protein